MKTFKNAILWIGIVAAAGFSVPVLAAEDPAAHARPFGVVDMDKVMQTTEAAKDIFSQLENKRKEYQAQITKEDDLLKAAKQEILKQKDSLSKDEFEKKGREFEEKVASGQKMVQDRTQILDHAFNRSMLKLRGEAAKVVASVAEEKRYVAVLTQDAVMISTPDMDITSEVIARMNKNVKKIPVDWSSPAEGKGAKKKK